MKRGDLVEISFTHSDLKLLAMCLDPTPRKEYTEDEFPSYFYMLNSDGVTLFPVWNTHYEVLNETG
jgi:hypothetical protein